MPYRKIKNKKKEKSEYREGKRSRQGKKASRKICIYAEGDKCIFLSSRGRSERKQERKQGRARMLPEESEKGRHRHKARTGVGIIGRTGKRQGTGSFARKASAEAGKAQGGWLLGQGRQADRTCKRTGKGHAQGRLFGQGRRRQGQAGETWGKARRRAIWWCIILYGGVVFLLAARSHRI